MAGSVTGSADPAIACSSRTDARLKGAWCHQLSPAECNLHWVRETGGRPGFACRVSGGTCRRGPACSDATALGPPADDFGDGRRGCVPSPVNDCSHVGCRHRAAQHPSEPTSSTHSLRAAPSVPLVEHCYSRSHNETKFAAFCEGREHLDQQHKWLAWLDRILLVHAAGGLGALSLLRYLEQVYPNTINVHVANASRMSFFWHSVPRRKEFRVLWSCTPCSSNGYRAPAALWAPSEEAFHNPFFLDRATLQSCNATEHPSCEQLLRSEDRRSLPVHFPGFFRAPALSGRRSYRRSNDSGIPDGAWCEVMRVARLNRERSPETSSTRGQIWFWLAEGSGIWWNVGRSLRLSHERNNQQSDRSTKRSPPQSTSDLPAPSVCVRSVQLQRV